MLTHFKNTHALVEHSRISHALCVSSLYPFIVYVCFLNVKNSLIDISSANKLDQGCICTPSVTKGQNLSQVSSCHITNWVWRRRRIQG